MPRKTAKERRDAGKAGNAGKAVVGKVVAGKAKGGGKANGARKSKGRQAKRDFKTKAEILSEETGIPVGLCQCGCGEKTEISHYTYAKFGWVRRQPIAFLVGHYGKYRRNRIESKAEQLSKKTKIPVGVCQCGCGKKTENARFTNKQYGTVAERPRAYFGNHARIKRKPGEVIRTEASGQVVVQATGHPDAKRNEMTMGRWVASHAFFNGGALPPNTQVIHRDGNPANNKPTNLFVRKLGAIRVRQCVWCRRPTPQTKAFYRKYNGAICDQCYAKGLTNPRANSPEVVESIRIMAKEHGMRSSDISRETGVPSRTVRRIVNGSVFRNMAMPEARTQPRRVRYRTKLTKHIVLQIPRMAKRLNVNQIARKIGVSRRTVASIVNGETWRHLNLVFDGVTKQDNYGRKLSDQDVRAMRSYRQVKGYTYKHLSFLFGISPPCAARVCKKLTYSHVK